jgi:hypothetical protein
MKGLTFNKMIKDKKEIIVLYIAIVGLLRELIVLWSKGMEILNSNEIIKVIFSSLYTSFNFRLFDFDYLTNISTINGSVFGYLDVIFFIILLVGYIKYYKSQKKDKTLLRFSFATLSFIGFTSIAFSFFIFFKNKQYSLSDFNFFYWFTISTFSIFWCYISFILFRLFSNDRKLITEESKYSVSNEVRYKLTSTSKKITYGLIDLVLSILTISIILLYLGIDTWGALERSIGLKWTIFILIILCRFVYLLFFEIIFGTTAGKILTKTRTINKDGNKPSFFSKLLNAIEFKRKWSNSIDVQEESDYSKPKSLLWLFTLILLILGLEIGGLYLFKYNKKLNKTKNIYYNSINQIKQDIIEIDSCTVLGLADAKYVKYGTIEKFLIVENVKDNIVTFSLIDEKPFNTTYESEIEKYYLTHKDSLKQIKFSKDSLLFGLNTSYNRYKKNKTDSKIRLQDKQYYFIKKTYKIFQPAIKCPGTGSYSGGKLWLDVYNRGRFAKLISINNISGNLEWYNEFPLDIKFRKNRGGFSIKIKANNYNQNQYYKSKLLFHDSLNNEYKYILEVNKTDVNFNSINDKIDD